MAYKELENLDKLDLSKVTMEDIRGLKSEALKKTLMEAVERSNDAYTSYQEHNAHSDHNNTGDPLNQGGG